MMTRKCSVDSLQEHRRARGGEVEEKSYSIDDVQSDVGHLAVLIEIALDFQLELPAEETERRHYAERISSLLWVARDLAEKIGSEVEENHISMRRSL